MKLIIFGSAPDVHVRYNSPYVSAYHAEILQLDNGDIILTDKGSRNGTFVNDIRIEPNKEVSIKRGDNVRFANERLNWNLVPMPQDLDNVKEMRGIGTNFRNRYLLQGDKVSRFHATLKLKKDGKWYIQDHSKNGTTVNGVKLHENEEVQLKKGDRILCAGVEAPNPLGKKTSTKPTKWIGGGIGICALISILFMVLPGGRNLFKGCKHSLPTDSELYEKYNKAIVLMMGRWHYQVTAGDLDLNSMGFPTEFVIKEGEIVFVKNEPLYMTYTGTGFFVSTDGKIVTNLHIAHPWAYEDLSAIKTAYKQMIAQIGSVAPHFNAYLDQVKVEGVLDHIGFICNGEYLAEENLVGCHELIASDNPDADVAILQSNKKKLPDDKYPWVNLEEAVKDPNQLKVGEHIYTMGFPLGLSAQDINSSKGLQLLARGGSVTQKLNDYSFGFDAASFGGASGSPIFNSKGQLVGILHAGFTQSQGFNYGINAEYAIELFNKVKSR